jgi:hypothetical protein
LTRVVRRNAVGITAWRARRPAAWLAVLSLQAGACGRGPDAETRRQTATIAEALRPAFFTATLRRMGGAHFHGTARFAAGTNAANEGVTTTTDVWLDRSGNYRVRELNDRDGGRAVVKTGRELAVALRYGKMIRRAAEEPEATRLLEEALGAPSAAWEIVAPAAITSRVGSELVGGARATRYRLSRASEVRRPTADGLRGNTRYAGLRAWRGTVSLQALTGQVLFDDATGALMQADFSATFSMRRDAQPLQGALEVHTVLTEVSSTAPIERPPAEDLTLRQRTVPEQRELLAGLPSSIVVPDPPRRPAAPARKAGKR